jgi:hypothetical protein
MPRLNAVCGPSACLGSVIVLADDVKDIPLSLNVNPLFSFQAVWDLEVNQGKGRRMRSAPSWPAGRRQSIRRTSFLSPTSWPLVLPLSQIPLLRWRRAINASS